MKEQIKKIYKEIEKLGNQFCDRYGFDFITLEFQEVWFKVHYENLGYEKPQDFSDVITMYVTFEDIEYIAASDLKDVHLMEYFRDAYYEQNTSEKHLPFVEWQGENKYTYQK